MPIQSSSNGYPVDVAIFSLMCKGGRQVFPFIVSRIEYKTCSLPSTKWDILHFTTIKGYSSGKSCPEFFRVKLPNSILWYGAVASFVKKHVLMVVYFDAEKKCIAHACYLIQCDPDTYLSPALYVTNQSSYKSFAPLPVEHQFFSQEIKANRFCVDNCIWNPLERTGRLSDDDGVTWIKFKLTLNLENMQVRLTLKPSDV